MTDRQPQTEAGRALLADPNALINDRLQTILDIEDQALSAVRERIEGLPVVTVERDTFTALVSRPAVLAILTPEGGAKEERDLAIYEGHHVDPALGVCLVCGDSTTPEARTDV